MRKIDTIVKLLIALVLASGLSLTAMADHHESGAASGDAVEASDNPPVDSAPPDSGDEDDGEEEEKD